LNETEAYKQPPSSALSSAGSIEEVLTDFDRHLEGQRGCTLGTRKHYLGEARALLVRVFPAQEINWDNLTAQQIADFVSGRAQKLSLVSRQNPATAIRSLLRFLTGEGLIRSWLDGAVPPIWRSKHATVPRHVSAEQLENMLALCPSEGPGAVRNRAMLLLSASPGVRVTAVGRSTQMALSVQLT
jgi:site-specific recombinase XerD